MKAIRFAALAAAVLTSLALGGRAEAIPIPPDPDDPSPTYHIQGSVRLTGCTTSAAKVHVRATGPRALNATVTGGPTTFRYLISGAAPTQYTVRPFLDAGVCPYGAWQPTQQTVRLSKQAPVAVADFTYTAPQHVTRIPASVATGVLDDALDGLRLRLNNYGPRHGASHHLPNSSSISLGGGTTRFTIPDHQIDLDCGVLCPDLGQGRFYVNNVNLDELGVSWSSSALQVAAGFESAGREVKGYRTYNNSVQDNLMPDVEINDARLRVSLVPVADGRGSITYRRQGPVSFDGTIQATGICRVFGVDICNFLTGYKGKIRDAVEGPLGARLDAANVKAAVAAEFRPILDQLGIGTVRAVVAESNSIVIVW